MNNLEAAGIHFQKVDILTDSGSIDVDVSHCHSLVRAGLTDFAGKGLLADAGSFATMGGQITGKYTIPPANLTFNTAWA